MIGVATGYGLDGPEFEPRWGKELFFPPCPSRLALEPNWTPLQWVLGFFPGVKAIRASLSPPTPSEWLQMHVYFALCLLGFLQGEFYLRFALLTKNKRIYVAPITGNEGSEGQ